MTPRNTALSLFAAGAAAGLTLTYATRRARLRKTVTQSVTIVSPRASVESFVESRERMLVALEHKRRLGLIDRLEVRDAPSGRGTEVHLSMRGLGKYQIKEILRRAKALLEADEIPTGRRYAS